MRAEKLSNAEKVIASAACPTNSTQPVPPADSFCVGWARPAASPMGQGWCAGLQARHHHIRNGGTYRRSRPENPEWKAGGRPSSHKKWRGPAAMCLPDIPDTCPASDYRYRSICSSLAAEKDVSDCAPESFPPRPACAAVLCKGCRSNPQHPVRTPYPRHISRREGCFAGRIPRQPRTCRFLSCAGNTRY
jgi:hypothetical protein